MTQRHQTLEQLIIRDEHPEFATVEARVLDEARQTLLALTKGEHPKTVLGGLMLRGHWSAPSALEDLPRCGPEIAAIAELDAGDHLNHRGDTIHDVLADLVEIGWVEKTTSNPIEDLIDGRTQSEEYRLMASQAELVVI